MSQFMKSVGAGRGSSAPRRPMQANICLQITNFDLQAEGGARVEGVAVSPAWLEGQTISVRMQNEQECIETFRAGKSEKDNRKFFSTRPTIEGWAEGFRVGRNDIPAMNIGGYLMMHGCLHDGPAPQNGEPGRWKAQYADNFGNDPSRVVVAGVARISVQEKNGYTFGKAEILRTADSVLLKDEQDLRRFFGEHMSGERDGAQVNGLAAFRICAPVGEGENVRHEVMTAFAYSPTQKVLVSNDKAGEFETYVPLDDAAAYQRMATSDKMLRTIYAALTGDMNGLEGRVKDNAELLRRDIQDGKVSIEAVPGECVPIVGNTLDELLKDGSKLNRAGLRSQYKASDRGQEVWRNGFVKMTVSLSRSPLNGAPDQVIVSTFATDANAYGMSINSVKTPLIVPEFGQRRELAQQASAAAAAQRGGEESRPGLDDDHASDDSLEMAGADNDAGPGMGR